MVNWPGKRRCGPIGVDIGSRSVKLLQLSADRSRVCEAVHWDLPPIPTDDPEQYGQAVSAALMAARQQRDFRGRDAVFCLNAHDLFVQNIRVPQADGEELRRSVAAEAAGRVPFASDEMEVRYFEADNVRQGDAVRREVILLACHRPVIGQLIGIAESAGLQPVAIDVEPAALLRCYAKQFRRDEDQQQRSMFINLGASTSAVVIARGADAMFVKYIDAGGRQLDEAVARHLKMKLSDASALRRHNGDRRADQRDPEVARSIAEAVRPILEKLASEISMCIRYYSVTFRGQPLTRVVVSGGEATQSLVEWVSDRLGMTCELGDPLRSFEKDSLSGRSSQWDVAAGLALRDQN